MSGMHDRGELVVFLTVVLFLLCSYQSTGAAMDVAQAAQAYREALQPVIPLPDGTILCEAEEFRVETPGWQAREWGTNYYAATFANTFLSRKAYLGAPEQCERTIASIEAQVPRAGRYLALVRYEAAYRFETQFRLRIEQNGQTTLDRLYGSRANLKVWAFGEKLKNEVAWYWGAVENIVWEGHDAYVNLQAGTARLELVAQNQPAPAARRNVDLVLLTTDEAEVRKRIEGEGYLPLDGLLTQAGDVYLKLHNHADGSAMRLTIPPCTEHAPYWVHMRRWGGAEAEAAPGQSTDWVEVGRLLDSLNDGQWSLTAAPAQAGAALHYSVEFGVRQADGTIRPIRTFECRGSMPVLAYDANMRYTRGIRAQSAVLHDLVRFLRDHPVRGKPPLRTLIIGHAFDERPGDPNYTAARTEFINMIPLTALMPRDPQGKTGPPMPTGYIDVRYQNPQQLEETCKELQARGQAENIAVVSLGDEIGLPSPPAGQHEAFRDWLKAKGLKPADLDPAAGDDWNNIQYSPGDDAARNKPLLYYYSQLYAHHYGIQQMKALTDVLRRYLPNAGIGANYSPHPHAYLGPTHMWATLFRQEGMTLPWSEDYIWQLPMGSQQMNFISLDLFRAGIKGKPDAKILFYVMPHWPGNTPSSWRRQFYGDIAHGMKIVDLFEFRPVQAAYTENHVSLPEMYLEVRRAFHEMGLFEDIMQEGQVTPGTAALWFSEAGDIWDDSRSPFGAAKRALYVAILHQQLPLDFVIEEDALAGELKNHQVLYLTDAHVSRGASRAIAEWVAAGGRLFATAGAGMSDERNQPNTLLRGLLGVEQVALDVAGDVKFIKQDLPFAEPVDVVTWNAPSLDAVAMPVIGARSRFRVNGAEAVGTFNDGSPAITLKQTGRGIAIYCGFLPGLAYFKPAIPMRPVDRGTTDDSMAHFIPTNFDLTAAALIGQVAGGVQRPVVCSDPLVEARIISAPQGLLIPLVNWRGQPLKDLSVTVVTGRPVKEAVLASGGRLDGPISRVVGAMTFRLDLDVADALILR